jgi:hypothetical protein
MAPYSGDSMRELGAIAFTPEGYRDAQVAAQRSEGLTVSRQKPKMTPGMTSEISIGSIAVAKLRTDACFVGEVGVCYGIGDFEGQAVSAFIFETGRFMVFTAETVSQALSLIDRICEAAADYSYTNDAQLKTDFRAGRFAAAFPALRR